MDEHTLKSFDVNTAGFLNYAWPFFNIIREMVESNLKSYFIKHDVIQ